MIVPELPAEIRELKDRVARYVEQEVYPVEGRIAERGSIDADEVAGLRRKAREAGFAMLNMPPEHGGVGLSMLGQVAIEEESGKATNGLGFAVVDRGPRELLELATPDQAGRFVAPIVRGEYREAWALTEPGAGSDLSALETSAVRDGDGWLLNGEKWFVTSQGDPGVYVVAAVAEDEQMLFLVEPDAPGLEILRTPGFLHDPYLDRSRQGLDAEALRLGDGRPGRRPDSAGAWRARLPGREPRRPLLPRASRRQDLGGDERDPAPDHRRLFKRGSAPYLGWE